MSATERIAALQSQIAALEATISTLQSSRTPSALSIALATAILAALGGYFYTQASGIGLFGSSPSRRSKKKSKPKPSSWPNSYDVTVHPDSSDDELMSGLTRGEDGIAASSSPSSSSTSSDEEDKREYEDEDEEFGQDQGDLALFPSTSTEECKLTIVIRTDLSMTRGKIAAQASHATLANYRYFLAHAPHHPVLKRWEQMGQAKVALQVKSEDELLELQAKAVSLGLCAQVVRDAGRTQIAAGSVTCLGVGPGPRSVVDEITGGLKLL